MKRTILALLLVLLIVPTFGSDKKYPSGARSAAMAYATVMLPDFWSVFNNQAGLAYINQMSAGIYHNMGMIREMSYQSVAFVYPTSTGTFASSGTYYGYSKYNEIKAGLAFGKLLGESFSLGVQIDYYSTHIHGVEDDLAQITFEAGILYKPFDELYVGVHAYNPANSYYSYPKAYIPSVFRLGCAYSFDSRVMTTLEIEKESEHNSSVKTGLEYSFLKNFNLRAGVIVNPVVFSFGMGYQLNNFIVDLAFYRHQVLGYVPNFSLQVNL